MMVDWQKRDFGWLIMIFVVALFSLCVGIILCATMIGGLLNHVRVEKVDIAFNESAMVDYAMLKLGVDNTSRFKTNLTLPEGVVQTSDPRIYIDGAGYLYVNIDDVVGVG
jgi:hypothetical protein